MQVTHLQSSSQRSSPHLTRTTTTGHSTVHRSTSLAGGSTNVPTPTWTESTSRSPQRMALRGKDRLAKLTRWNSPRWRLDRSIKGAIRPISLIITPGDYLYSSQWTRWQWLDAVVEIKRVTLMHGKNTAELFNGRMKNVSSVTESYSSDCSWECRQLRSPSDKF